ncbi:MAG: GIY-YIG nuclease family protein [Deltaproteobacteria bacterium]|nr:GIY-YIG nuclease family protein [Deltaproteobacteria bacterium]
MAFWVYILKCNDDSYYTGHTDDLEKRMFEHHSGAIEGYTKNRRPLRLIFCEQFSSREDAFQRERQIKGWSRLKKEALIKEDWELLSFLSRKKSAHPSTSSG